MKRDYALLKEIGLRVRTQRESLKYTREELAELLGISVNFCSEIENGKKGMSIETLSKVAKVLHLSVDYIVNGSTNSSDTNSITLMLESCDEKKLPYLEEMIKTFIKAMD